MENDKVALLNQLIQNFDNNIKILDFYLSTESFYDASQTDSNIVKVNQRLADASSIVN